MIIASISPASSDDQVFEIIQVAAFYHQVAFIANGLAIPIREKRITVC
jgi:hypothetical protein